MSENNVAADELPIYIVMGANWECEVAVSQQDYEMKLPVAEHMIEAATKAVEIVRGVIPSDSFRILDAESAPYLGIVIHVHLKGKNPKSGEFIPSYIVLANGGFYKESAEAHKLLQEQEATIQPVNKQNKKPTKLIKPSKNKTRKDKK